MNHSGFILGGGHSYAGSPSHQSWQSACLNLINIGDYGRLKVAKRKLNVGLVILEVQKGPTPLPILCRVTIVMQSNRREFVVESHDGAASAVVREPRSRIPKVPGSVLLALDGDALEVDGTLGGGAHTRARKEKRVGLLSEQ